MAEKITTIYGLMDPDTLEKREGVVKTDEEHTTWVEYWLDGELVHRSVHVTVLQPAASEAAVALLG